MHGQKDPLTILYIRVRSVPIAAASLVLVSSFRTWALKDVKRAALVAARPVGRNVVNTSRRLGDALTMGARQKSRSTYGTEARGRPIELRADHYEPREFQLAYCSRRTTTTPLPNCW